MVTSTAEEEETESRKLVKQKEGFPYDKYQPKFQFTFEERLKEELKRNGDTDKIMNTSQLKRKLN